MVVDMMKTNMGFQSITMALFVKPIIISNEIKEILSFGHILMTGFS
jgi:hypothetical protein